jgi:hypothetical protein
MERFAHVGEWWSGHCMTDSERYGTKAAISSDEALRSVDERLKVDPVLRRLHSDLVLLAALGEVNRLASDSDDPLERMLQGLVELAVKACGAAEAGMSLLDERGRLSARAVSSEVAHELCELQFRSGGPAIAVLQDKKPRIDYADGLGEWSELVEAMARHGLEWVVSQPILPDVGEKIGVFNLYGCKPLADVHGPIQLLADHTAGVITNGLLYSSATELARQLEKALDSRGVIEQAKGVLMAWQGCEPDTAFDILRRVSQRENRKLRVVAEEIVSKARSSGGMRR